MCSRIAAQIITTIITSVIMVFLAVGLGQIGLGCGWKMEDSTSQELVGWTFQMLYGNLFLKEVHIGI